jgi:hypothetical protein
MAPQRSTALRVLLPSTAAAPLSQLSSFPGSSSASRKDAIDVNSSEEKPDPVFTTSFMLLHARV